MQLNAIPEILSDFKQGKIVILLDDEREHEGDMIVAAEHATATVLSFMMKYGCGIICMSITSDIAENFKLDLLPRKNCDDINSCFFTVSVDAKNGIQSGISAYDKAVTIKTLISHTSSCEDIKVPGHLFPLIANPAGVLGRAGHTEASVDLAKLCRLIPAAVLVEVMNEEKNTPANNEELYSFAQKHQIKISTIKALIEYRQALLA